MLLPRPDLLDLGITHRRVPILAIGKDIYCDSSCAVRALGRLSAKLLPSPSDAAYESYCDSIFSALLRSFPVEDLAAFTKDRATIFRKFHPYLVLDPSYFITCANFYSNIHPTGLCDSPPQRPD